MTKPNFARDLKVGQAAELSFIKLAASHGIILTQTDGRKGDLVDIEGKLWECKGDQYDHNKTANFFIELFSDVEAAKKGGPWQALDNKCDYFVYFFSANKIAYIFSTEDLVRQVDHYLSIEKPPLIEIRNRAWITVGAKVPRSALVPINVLQSKEAK
jgi:hypothetical protein